MPKWPRGLPFWQYKMACRSDLSVWPNQNDYAETASRLDCRNGVVNVIHWHSVMFVITILQLQLQYHIAIVNTIVIWYCNCNIVRHEKCKCLHMLCQTMPESGQFAENKYDSSVRGKIIKRGECVGDSTTSVSGHVGTIKLCHYFVH